MGADVIMSEYGETLGQLRIHVQAILMYYNRDEWRKAHEEADKLAALYAENPVNESHLAHMIKDVASEMYFGGQAHGRERERKAYNRMREQMFTPPF